MVQPSQNLTSKSDWNSTSSGAICYYDNDSSNVDTFGVLYNGHAVKDSRSIAPEGWHVPTDDEWSQLEEYIGNRGHSGAEGLVLRSSSGWYDGLNGTDDYGFAALPGGLRGPFSESGDNLPEYGLKGFQAYFWSSSEGPYRFVYFRGFGMRKSTIDRYPAHRGGDGFSVRLVKD